MKKPIDKRHDLRYYITCAAQNAVWRGSIAQLGEHLPYKQRVTGSSPVVPTTTWPGSSVGLECQPVTLEVEGSSPFRVAIFALVAQSVEHVTENHSVGGSIPPQGTFYAVVAQLVERHLAKVEVASPSLVYRSIFSRRHSQVVRRRSAKPLLSGPNPDGASQITLSFESVFFFASRARCSARTKMAALFSFPGGKGEARPFSAGRFRLNPWNRFSFFSRRYRWYSTRSGNSRTCRSIFCSDNCRIPSCS